MTQTTILVLAAVLIPVAWGCGSHWLLERCWPRRNGRDAGTPDKTAVAADYLDYQI